MKVTVPIDDLTCGGGGSLTVERRLTALPGVTYVYVNSATEMAYVVFDPDACRVDQIQTAIRDLGFRPGEPVVRGRTWHGM